MEDGTLGFQPDWLANWDKQRLDKHRVPFPEHSLSKYLSLAALSHQHKSRSFVQLECSPAIHPEWCSQCHGNAAIRPEWRSRYHESARENKRFWPRTDFEDWKGLSSKQLPPRSHLREIWYVVRHREWNLCILKRHLNLCRTELGQWWKTQVSVPKVLLHLGRFPRI